MTLRDGNRIPGSVHDLTATIALSDVADQVLFVSPRTLRLLGDLAEVEVKILSRYAKSYLAGGMVDVVEDEDSQAEDVDEIANRFGIEVVPVTTVRDVISATMYKTAAGQTLTTSVQTKIVFGAVDSDPLAICDLTNEQITIPRTGRYIVTGHLAWAANATGARYLIIDRNGVTLTSAQLYAAANAIQQQSVTVSAYLTAGDVLQLHGLQQSGGNLQVEYISASVYRNSFGVIGF